MNRQELLRIWLGTALSAGLGLSLVACTQENDKAPEDGDRPESEGEAAGETSDLGVVDFGAACEESVQEDFDRALALMHHMMYQQARAAFVEITETEPDCAMAHWGVATTLFQPLWPERPDADALARGRERIERARETGAGSEREAALIDASAAFFRAPESDAYRDRLEAWAEGMADAYEAHPDDLDIAAFYGLSRLALAAPADNRRRGALLDEAESVLRAVWEQENTHPGAVHYTIHATDADGRAENALDIVASYGEIAPSVPHALHMPSHIYVRLGDWDSVIEWNGRSADAAINHRVEGAISFHYLHAMDYRVYGYLQQGRDDLARAAYAEAMGHDRHQPSFAAAFHAAAMPARIAVERRDWEAARAIEPRTPDYLPWDAAQWPESLSWFARGLGALHTGEIETARAAENKLKSLRNRARDGGEADFATYIETDRRILAGWLAQTEGDTDQAIEHLQVAGELEAAVEKSPITPGALLPPNEALGVLYMTLEQPEDALAAYEASDAIWPGRFNTLLGAGRAAEAAEKPETARDYYRQLVTVAGESERPAINQARTGLE